MGAMKRRQAFRFAGACRFVHNRALALEIDRHASGEAHLGYVGTANLLPLWKRDPETVWLSGVHSQILQQSLKDLDRAYRNFVEKRAGFPKFQRNDFLHKVSTTICKSHAVVVVEDLNVKGMSASAAGTVEAPGRNVRQKSGLSRSLLDQGWSAFLLACGTNTSPEVGAKASEPTEAA